MAQKLIGALNKIISKIEVANIIAVNEVGQHVQGEFRKLVQREVYDAYSPERYERTNALRLSPTIVSVGREGVRIEFADNGHWHSVKTGEHFYALYGLEGGYTWGRPPSNIMREVTSNGFKDQISNIYIGSMRRQGIPIVRR